MKLSLGFITWIKSLSLPVKIGICSATLTVAGGATTAVIVTSSQNNNSEISAPQLAGHDDKENSLKVNDEEKTEESEQTEESEPTTASSQETTANSNSNTKSTNNIHNANQSPSSNSSSSQQQQSTQTTPAKTADYNLNTPYYLSIWGHKGYYNKCWQTIGDAPKSDSEAEVWSNKFYTPECQGQEASPEIFGVGRSIAEAGQAVTNKASKQYPHYYFAMKFQIYEGLLTEAYCSKYGLSCDRW